MRKLLWLGLLALPLAALPFAARAEATGQVDWNRRVIHARGQGAPDLDAPSVSAARLGAEKAAKADALRNLLETLQGLELTSGDKARTLLQDATLRGQVEGTLRGFTVVAPHYYADGGVALDVEVSLDKLPAELLGKLSREDKKSGEGAGPAATPGPATLPKAKDEAGKTPAQPVQPAPIAQGKLQARGQGLPDPGAASPAAARLGAERAARLDALRVLLAALRAGDAGAGKRIEADASLASQVDGALRGYAVTAVHYYSDGGVALDVEVPIASLPPELREKIK